MVDFWKGKKVLVTGGTGFLASHLIPMLENAGADVTAIGSEYNLTTLTGAFLLFSDKGTPDVLFHLAANVGGIGYNRDNPDVLLRDNALMGIYLLQTAAEKGVGKVVAVGSTCAYPKMCPVPFKEESLFDGFPESTNAPYGEAKRLMLVYLDALRKRRGLRYVYAIPTNLYGEHDQFDPEKSHVIPALIKKCLEAEDVIEVWGTGRATRDFLHAEDCARGLMVLAEKGQGAVNLGSGQEVPISDLVGMIAFACGFKGRVELNKEKPDGQPRRALDITRAKSLGWEPRIGLVEGIRRTVEWYKANQE